MQAPLPAPRFDATTCVTRKSGWPDHSIWKPTRQWPTSLPACLRPQRRLTKATQFMSAPAFSRLQSDVITLGQDLVAHCPRLKRRKSSGDHAAFFSKMNGERRTVRLHSCPGVGLIATKAATDIFNPLVRFACYGVLNAMAQGCYLIKTWARFRPKHSMPLLRS